MNKRDYQSKIVNEGYQPKGEKVDLKTLILPKGGTAAFTPRKGITIYQGGNQR